MNDHERDIAAALRARGFTVLRDGWPDFLVIGPKGTSCFGLELKRGNDKLRPSQRAMHTALRAMGLPIYVGDGSVVVTTHSQLLARPAQKMLDDVLRLRAELAALEKELRDNQPLIDDTTPAITTPLRYVGPQTPFAGQIARHFEEAQRRASDARETHLARAVEENRAAYLDDKRLAEMG